MDKISIGGLNIKITKIDAVRFKESGHPNGIDEGYEQIGQAHGDIIVGSCAYIGSLICTTSSRNT